MNPLSAKEVAAIMKDEVPKLLQMEIEKKDKRIEDLERQLSDLIYCAENNSGYVPSLCCYQRAIAESKKLLGIENDKK